MQSKLAELRAKRKQDKENDARARADQEDADSKKDDIDRHLDEKRRATEADQDAKKVNDELKVFEEVKNGIAVIRRNIAMITELKVRSNKEVNVDAFKQIMKQLDSIMQESKSNAAAVKTKLKEIDEANALYEKGTVLQMRLNNLQSYTKTFAETMKEYSDASSQFQKALKERIKRQAEVVKPDVTEAELEKIAEDPQAFMESAMLNRAVIDVISDIEDKHARILEIERSVHYINELFHDLATLVAIQQEHLDLIEQNVTETKNLTQKGKEDIQDAHEYQTKSRKVQCCIVVILIVVLLIVLIPTLRAQGVLGSS